MANYTPHERYQAHLSRTPSPSKDPDAGLRGLGHYERRLPRWRFKLRQLLIPVVRWETPYLAHIQHVCRSPPLDTYFAFTANLGTHTFFMTALPICFWCGYPEMGISLVHMLAMGVYFSGFVKDMVCLPRPLSPPLQRITMSGSAALEYGFPSTHTTNAVSVAIYCLYQLYSARSEYSDFAYAALTAILYFYAISITLGRMYCGMHGFFDVVFGGILGALIAWIRIAYGTVFDQWILADGWTRPVLVVAALAVAVRIHPEPADNCPCFDDSVAFIGVVMGAKIGVWQHGQVWEGTDGFNGTLAEMFPYHNQDLLRSVARIVGGIIVIFVWRAVMKPTLLRFLPPIFRVIDRYGLSIPRRYFLQPRQYKTVPPLRKDDNIIPPASEIPAMMSNLRHPRKRTVSIGPQSEADAREYIANREQRRRNSRSEGTPHKRPSRDRTSKPSLPTPSSINEDASAESNSGRQRTEASYMNAGVSSSKSGSTHLKVGSVDPNLLTPPASDGGASSDGEDSKNDREMFSHLEKPRIRYDVEVITKLVVYAGIAWWAVLGNPLWFHAVGLA
jgi:dihydrosphingosine 1-phosphate phosphatase